MAFRCFRVPEERRVMKVVVSNDDQLLCFSSSKKSYLTLKYVNSSSSGKKQKKQYSITCNYTHKKRIIHKHVYINPLLLLSKFHPIS